MPLWSPSFGLYASDADLAEAFAHVAAVTPTTKVVCGDGDEAFVAQLAFLEPEVNRAIDAVAVHTQPVTVRCVRVGDDDQVPLQPSQQVIRDTVNYRLVVDSAAADASTAFGSWLRLHTSAPPTSSELDAARSVVRQLIPGQATSYTRLA
jgi:hypothetical protein